MKLATVFKITNPTDKDLRFYSEVDDEMGELDFFSSVIPANSFTIQDFRFRKYNILLKLNEFCFQFIGEEEKMTVDDLKEHAIELEIFLP